MEDSGKGGDIRTRILEAVHMLPGGGTQFLR